MKTLVIYNPNAGRLAARVVAERAAAWWRALGWQVEIEGTRMPGEATPLARRAAEAGYDAVVVAGGDGTLSQAADGLAGSATALGVLPLGTSNVWAQEVGLPFITDAGGAGTERAAQVLADARILAIDLGRVGARHFLLWVGVGLDAHIVSRVEPRTGFAKRLGVPYYFAASLVAGMDWTGVEMTVEVDGKTIAGCMLLVLVGNNRLYGGGLFSLSPRAQLDDGMLETWTIEGRSYGDTLALTLALIRRQHVNHPRVTCLAGRRITITSPRALPVQGDGDLWDCRTPMTVEVAPRALRMLVPTGAPADLFSGAHW